MRKAMFEAEVGDDVFREDPTVNLLEDRMARMFGKEKALYFPTGTMCNLGDKSHIHIYEQGGVSQFGGVATHILPNHLGSLTPRHHQTNCCGSNRTVQKRIGGAKMEVFKWGNLDKTI